MSDNQDEMELTPLPVHVVSMGIGLPAGTGRSRRIVSQFNTIVMNTTQPFGQVAAPDINRIRVRIKFGDPAQTLANHFVICSTQAEAQRVAGAAVPLIISGCFISKDVAFYSPATIVDGTSEIWIAAVGSITDNLYAGVVIERYLDE